MKIDQLKARARRLKAELRMIYYAYQDPRVPLLPKLIIILTLSYALSPIDLIPDFIPVLGYLDDLIIVPALIALSIALLPTEIVKEAREKAEAAAKEEAIRWRKRWLFAIFFILIWLFLLIILTVLFLRLISK